MQGARQIETTQLYSQHGPVDSSYEEISYLPILWRWYAWNSLEIIPPPGRKLGRTISSFPEVQYLTFE